MPKKKQSQKAIHVFDPTLVSAGANPKHVQRAQESPARAHTLPDPTLLIMAAFFALLGGAFFSFIGALEGIFTGDWAYFATALSLSLAIALPSLILGRRIQRSNDVYKDTVLPAVVDLQRLLPGKNQDRRFAIADPQQFLLAQEDITAVIKARSTLDAIQKVYTHSPDLTIAAAHLDTQKEADHLSRTLVRLTLLRKRLADQRPLLASEPLALATLDQQQEAADSFGAALQERCSLVKDYHENLKALQKRSKALKAAQDLSHNDVLLARLDGSTLSHDLATSLPEHESAKTLSGQTTALMDRIQADYDRLTTTALTLPSEETA